jgi:2-amino-4-hydroxy-6-hydroxymethyldihydropteridine diphosphokinase
MGMKMDRIKVALGLGSNLGNRQENIDEAIRLLKLEGLKDVVVSEMICSEPVDCPDEAEEFLNGAACGEWPSSCENLLISCQKIEHMLGRPAVREINSPRPIDIDILLFGEEIYNENNLVVPHPRMMERDFVLKPLSEIAGDWVIPEKHVSVRAAAKEL